MQVWGTTDNYGWLDSADCTHTGGSGAISYSDYIPIACRSGVYNQRVFIANAGSDGGRMAFKVITPDNQLVTATSVAFFLYTIPIPH